MNNTFNNNIRVFIVLEVSKECSSFCNSFKDRLNRVDRVVGSKQVFSTDKTRFPVLKSCRILRRLDDDDDDDDNDNNSKNNKRGPGKPRSSPHVHTKLSCRSWRATRVSWRTTPAQVASDRSATAAQRASRHADPVERTLRSTTRRTVHRQPTTATRQGQ